jgi:hypothetical protein
VVRQINPSNVLFERLWQFLCCKKKTQHNFLLFQLCDHIMIFVILEPWVGNECVVMLTGIIELYNIKHEL